MFGGAQMRKSLVINRIDQNKYRSVDPGSKFCGTQFPYLFGENNL